MGVALTVYPVTHHQMEWWLCVNRLDFEGKKDKDWLATVCSATPKKLPKRVYVEIYTEGGLDQVTHDSYDQPLTFVPAGSFRNFKEGSGSKWNIAILMFLQTIPPETPIVLYWH